MSITRSFNKHTGKYYAYETSYEWDDAKQKKIQRKKCIGQFDPITGEVIPNGRRGRPKKTFEKVTEKQIVQPVEQVSVELERLNLQIETLRNTYNSLLTEMQNIGRLIEALQQASAKIR